MKRFTILGALVVASIPGCANLGPTDGLDPSSIDAILAEGRGVHAVMGVGGVT